jgi:hypothetical protein
MIVTVLDFSFREVEYGNQEVHALPNLALASELNVAPVSG